MDEFCSRVTPELPLRISDTELMHQLHCTTSHFGYFQLIHQLHCTTLLYIALHRISDTNCSSACTVFCTALHFALHCFLHYTEFHCISLHCVAFLIAELHQSLSHQQHRTNAKFPLYSVHCRLFNTMCVISVLRSAEKDICVARLCL